MLYGRVDFYVEHFHVSFLITRFFDALSLRWVFLWKVFTVRWNWKKWIVYTPTILQIKYVVERCFDDARFVDEILIEPYISVGNFEQSYGRSRISCHPSSFQKPKKIFPPKKNNDEKIGSTSQLK